MPLTMENPVGTGLLMGVPPGFNVIVAPASKRDVVVDGTENVVVVPERMIVSDDAEEGGNGFGSGLHSALGITGATIHSKHLLQVMYEYEAEGATFDVV